MMVEYSRAEKLFLLPKVVVAEMHFPKRLTVHYTCYVIPTT